MKTISRYIMTLALLLTAVTGAWAEEKMVTINSSTMSSGAVTATGFGILLDNLYVGSNPATITTSEGVITKLVIKKGTIYVDAFTEANVGVTPGTITYGSDEITVTDINAESVTLSRKGDDNWSTSSVDVYFGTAEAPITVEPGSSANTWTFTMPGSDVVLTPQYAPAAQLDENGAPAAVSGLEIAADAAIITAGQSAQGTLLYAVGTSQTEKPALTVFSATLPNAKDQTAAGNYYVWYYIQGQDTPQGQEPTAENTFNDSEIMGPVIVELLTNEHTLNIKQSPNITVTVAGTAVTPTDDKVTPVTTGQEVKIKAKEGYKFRKVEVKKKAAEKTIKIDGQDYTVLNGETWSQFISRNKLSGWYLTTMRLNTWSVCKTEPESDLHVSSDGTNWTLLEFSPKDAPIDTDKQYKWVTVSFDD